MNLNSELLEPRLSIPVTPLGPDESIDDVEESTPAKLKAAPIRCVSGKFPKERSPATPLYDCPFSILQNLDQLGGAIRKCPKKTGDIFANRLSAFHGRPDGQLQVDRIGMVQFRRCCCVVSGPGVYPFCQNLFRSFHVP